MIEPLLQAERLLVVGQLDEAEQLYRLTVAQDPQNSIAVVGLARVAVERGDNRLALEHARAALTIDPQNQAAIRLVARLEEILAAPVTAAPAADHVAPLASDESAERSAAEEIAFTRNPSMADHQRRMEQARQPTVEPPSPPSPAHEPAHPRRGIIARLLRRPPGA